MTFRLPLREGNKKLETKQAFVMLIAKIVEYKEKSHRVHFVRVGQKTKLK